MEESNGMVRNDGEIKNQEIKLRAKIAKYHYFLKFLVFYHYLRNIQQSTIFWNSSFLKKSTWNLSSLWYKTYCLCFKILCYLFHYIFTIVDLSAIPRDLDKRKKKEKPTPGSQWENWKNKKQNWKPMKKKKKLDRSWKIKN